MVSDPIVEQARGGRVCIDLHDGNSHDDDNDDGNDLDEHDRDDGNDIDLDDDRHDRDDNADYLPEFCL